MVDSFGDQPPSNPYLGQSQRFWPRLSWSDNIHIVKACTTEADQPLVAIGGSLKLEVFEMMPNEIGGISFRSLASYLIGSKPTSIAWSPACRSPYQTESGSEAWRIELLVTASDQTVRLLTSFGPEGEDSNQIRLGKTSGIVTSLDWCSAEGYHRFAASAEANGTLTLWDLSTISDFSSRSEGGEVEKRGDSESSTITKVVHFGEPLQSVSFHPKLARMILISSTNGVIRLVDWLSSLSNDKVPQPTSPSIQGQQANQRLVLKTALTLRSPSSLSSSITRGLESKGNVSWQIQDPNMIGGSMQARWMIWNLTKYNGGNPILSGSTDLIPSSTDTRSSSSSSQKDQETYQGGFRWCPTNPHLFTTFNNHPPTNQTANKPFENSNPPVDNHHRLSSSKDRSAQIRIYDSSHPNAPRSVTVSDLLTTDKAKDLVNRPPNLTTSSFQRSSNQQRSTTTSSEAGSIYDVDWIRGLGTDTLGVALANHLVLVPAYGEGAV
ncbi:hypothetical protein IE53DRAFT_205907 [Violaceomyces palustris]|uniref:Uncharacterized protein n=1 Tax=Violaceomyces palustris TaxID=1673888 RepID=A0ACD0P536_9BASI|nr:hypothetical protein IE53DRAFT_205907 [Violaceomyces palustris]